LTSQQFVKVPGVFANRAQIISRVLELAEKNNDRILYAA
jgi:type I restriction enzyme R subunit